MTKKELQDEIKSVEERAKLAQYDANLELVAKLRYGVLPKLLEQLKEFDPWYKKILRKLI